MENDLNPRLWPLLLESDLPAAGAKIVTAPYDGSVIAEVSTCDEAHVDEALGVAAQCHNDRANWLPLFQRIEILEKAATLMTAEREFLSLETAREGGKPLPDSIVEVDRAIDGLKLCIEHIRASHGEVIPMGATASSAGRIAFTQKEPIGVVVAISAFNHPLNLIVHQVAAAVAAGCPVIVKPSGDTPLACLRLAAILYQAGLPKNWCQVTITHNTDASQKLVTDSRVGFFSFIGSAAVGWKLRSLLSPGTRCALEHGGSAPLILAKDADQEYALQSVLKGGFYHAGQVCVSVQRVFAPAEMAEEFAKKLASLASELVVGDPTLMETQVGPLIRPKETLRVDEWVKASGVTPLCGGEPINDHLYPPTVLLNPSEDADVSQKEIFGPVVCVYSYDDLDEAIRRANQLPVAFHSAIFTQSIDTAMHAFKHLEASAVMVNDHTAFRIDGMPFAGLKQSGYGVGGISHTIDDMQIDKMLMINRV